MGLELPTESQWEYAARAGTTSVWWTGDQEESLRGAANLSDSYLRKSGGVPIWLYDEWLDDGYAAHAPVGSYAPNSFGLHDMIGNVQEWCRDWHGSYQNRVRQGDGEREVKEASFLRVYRGGSCNFTAAQGRSADRQRTSPESINHDIGVRPARRIKS